MTDFLNTVEPLDVGVADAPSRNDVQNLGGGRLGF